MATKKRVLITDDVHSTLLTGLSKYFDVDFEPSISYREVCDRIGPYSGLVINSKIRVDGSFIENADALEWVARLGSGLDVIDLEAASEANIDVINSPEGNANAVGEHALGMLLALLNKIPQADDMVRRMKPWNRESMRGRELDGLTIGIIGCGHTGSAFVKKLSGFDVTVLIYDKYRKQIPPIHRCQQETSLTKLLLQADIVSLHLPLTDETHGSINGDFIDRMKEGSILINTSRGKIVSLEDLYIRIENGQLAGACLDVFENEKPDQYLVDERKTMENLTKLNQIVLTPHVAGWTIESKRKIAEILLKKIIYVAVEG